MAISTCYACKSRMKIGWPGAVKISSGVGKIVMVQFIAYFKQVIFGFI